MPVMGALTLSLFAVGYGLRGPGRINRMEAAALLGTYAGYIFFLAHTLLSQ
jgi:cation:H+ antiporter